MHDAKIRLFWLLLSGGVLSLCALWLLQSISGYLIFRARRRKSWREAHALPAISVLKPLKGVDADLHTNLKAFMLQDYPVFELIVGVEEADDPAVSVVRDLIRDYPDAPLRLLIGAGTTGMNPKVNNLANLSLRARYDHFLISDADVRPEPGYLRTLAADLGDGVDLVHSLLVGRGERALGAVFESLHMNSFVAATVCGADVVRHACVIGKSMLFSREHLRKIGGFRSVENVLAEDYVLGQKFQKAGLRVRLSLQALSVVNPERDLRSFINRQLRWAQMRRRMNLRAYLAEGLGNPNVWLALCLAWVGLTTPAGLNLTTCVASVLAMMVAKCLVDVGLGRLLQGDFALARHFYWIPLKDMLISVIWCVGLFRRKVNWRGNVRWIGAESRLFLRSDTQQPVTGTVSA